jgi:predicted transcriptional regulator
MRLSSSEQRVMREANQQYGEREDARESFRQEAFSSWAEYQQSGRHLTGAEIREWLQSWSDKDGGDAPACDE